jgi:hypothetical protein
MTIELVAIAKGNNYYDAVNQLNALTEARLGAHPLSNARVFVYEKKAERIARMTYDSAQRVAEFIGIKNLELVKFRKSIERDMFQWAEDILKLNDSDVSHMVDMSVVVRQGDLVTYELKLRYR